MSTDLTKLSSGSIAELLKPKRETIIQLIGENNFVRETSFAIQAVQASDYLSKSSTTSVAKAIFNCAITGLSLNPVMKLSYIVPRAVNGKVEAIFQPSYQGLIKLVCDTGSVKQVYAMPVYEGDEFSVEYGTETKIIHKPKFNKNRKDEDIIYFYAVATLHDGSKQWEVMQVNEVNEIRDNSDGYKAFKNGKAKSAIWNDWFVEMGKKTIIKRLCKYLPKSSVGKQWERVMEAVDIDNKDYPATDGQYVYIERLISNSVYDHDTRERMEKKLEAGITAGEADDLIEDLQANQLLPNESAQISMTGAKEAVKFMVDKENS